jgi:hypothetical protein
MRNAIEHRHAVLLKLGVTRAPSGGWIVPEVIADGVGGAGSGEGSMAEAVAFQAAEDLSAFVHTVLCERDALDPAQTPLFRTPLKRNGRVCGVLFHVQGPRLLRNSAVWSADDARVIFYDSSGTRFREAALSESPVA